MSERIRNLMTRGRAIQDQEIEALTDWLRRQPEDELRPWTDALNHKSADDLRAMTDGELEAAAAFALIGLWICTEKLFRGCREEST